MTQIEKIQSINHHLRFALDQVSEGVLSLEAGSRTPVGPRIVYANATVERLSGYDSSHLLGQPIGMIFDRDHLPELLEKLDSLGQAAGPICLQRDLHARDGGRKRADWNFLPVKNSAGETVNFSVRIVSHDERESRRAREEAFRQDLARSRLESLLIVSGGIAHDFRNGLLAT